MRLYTYALPVMADATVIASCAVVVIDTLRFTSSAVTALENGCASIRTASSIEEARQIAASFSDEETLLCGERNALPIPGFALSNSPLEYTREAIEGKRLIMTTTNGTRAIAACKSAQTLLLGCLLNAKAVAEKLIRQKNDAVFVCAGTKGNFSLEDALTAGAIIDAFLPLCADDPAMDDMSLAALTLYRQSQPDMRPLLAQTAHYRHLLEKGYAADISHCLAQNTLSAVPESHNGKFTPA